MNGRLHVVRRPPADGSPPHPPVVVVHGTMDRASSFGRLANRLRDHEVVTFDRRGYAGSHHLAPASRFEAQVDDLADVVGSVPSLLVGHSYGGNVVLALAAERAEVVVAAVVFEAPAPWEPWWPVGRLVERDPGDAAERFMRRMIGDRLWEALPERTRQQRRAEGTTMLADMAALDAGRPYDPQQVRCPVVVGWGAGSPEHLRAAARLLAEELPDATGVEVAGSSHGVHLSHPAELAELVRRAESG